MHSPLVSICLPTYNGEVFLQEALDSILKQTYDNLEIIVSDDNSKDRTLDIVNIFKVQSTYPVFVYHHTPSGIGANWNNCVKNANGEYIKFLFQDDVLLPTCIEKMVGETMKNNNVGLIYSKREFLFNKNNKEHINWINTYKSLHTNWNAVKIENRKTNKGVNLLKDENLLEFPKNKIGEPTAVLLKKEVFEQIGYFSTTLKQALDIEFWYRVMKYYDFVFIDEPLVLFRLHDNQTSSINAQNSINEVELLERSIYANIFWQLSWKNKKHLFIKFSFLGRLYNKLKKIKMNN